MVVESGGGVGWYDKSVLSERKDFCGIGSDMTEPKKEIFAIHLEDSRGSSVNAAACQYLLRMH